MEVETEMSQMLLKHENSYVNQLLLALPASLIRTSASHHNPYEQVVHALQRISHTPRLDDDADDFFREVGVDKKAWSRLESGEEKYQLVLRSLEKSIEDNRKKVNVQLDNYVTNGRKSVTPSNKENRVRDPFEWLKLKNRYPMCEQKLKAKLVQAISDSKNEKRIRDRIASPEGPKVSLLDESLVVDEYEKIKIDYQWTEDDETVLIGNINSLKTKFSHTEFLKLSQRFRFISAHELETLAAEEISRRLDQDNKVYLSRQFLLDKYYSTREFLTEQEMRFILKTSPLLNKCVDKQFIRNAIKNIDHEDINRLELKIAENIIGRFEQIRKAVRESRKDFKQAKNGQIKERIVQFERRQEMEVAREMAREELARHKVVARKGKAKKFRHLPVNGESKKSFLPLNMYHPPSGLFVKDCNEQCIDDLFNGYETHYLAREQEPMLARKEPQRAVTMLGFYTGGMKSVSQQIPMEAINTICGIIKAHNYGRAIKEALDNYDLSKSGVSVRTNKSFKSNFVSQKTVHDLDKRLKSCVKITEESAEAAIKRKIIDNKEKAKGVIYVNKMLALAAENSFTAFKSLNAKYTPQQVNSRDHRGNTPLFYASRHGNREFISHLLSLGADPSIPSERGFTPLHYIFKTNNFNLIIRCLTALKSPNLNAVNADGKTPLAYCSHQMLTRLNLQEGVVVVLNRLAEFDNNLLLTRNPADKCVQHLEGGMRSGGRANTNQWMSGE